MRALRLAVAIIITVVAGANAAIPDLQIGAATVVVNRVYGSPESMQQSQWLTPGINIFQNESIVTGDKSASRMLFRDNTQLHIGADSFVRLDKFVYDPNPNNSQVTLSLVKGAFRFVTGKLSSDRYQVNTPAAFIAVRGTAFTVAILPNGGEYISVEKGTIFVTCFHGGTATIRAGQMTYINSPGDAPSPARRAVPIPAVTQMDALLH